MSEIITEPGRINIPSDQMHLQAVDEFLEESLRNYGMSESDIADVAISVTELVNNAIVHGNRNDIYKKVDVRMRLSGSEVMITVSDQGDGFDASGIPDPLSEENLLKETGRGIFIVRSLMDKVEMSAGRDGGTVVRLVKKFIPIQN